MCLLKWLVIRRGRVIADVIRSRTMPFTRGQISDLCQSHFSAITSGGSVAKTDQELDAFFADATAAELHEFPNCWNWDSGTDRIEQLVSHPNCDSGTALKTFWLFRPHYYLQFATRDDVPDYQRDDFDLMLRIQDTYINGYFVGHEMPFSPPRKPKQPRSEWVRVPPETMYESVGPQSTWRRIRSLMGV